VPAESLPCAEFAHSIETNAVEFSGNDGKINRLRIQKIQRVGSKLVFDMIDKFGRADQAQRSGPMQTYSE
jgi:hypothetical protein